jgi:translation initiation factor 1
MMAQGIVYSTEHGRMCPDCEKPSKECVCSRKKAALPGDGIVRVTRETKGRRGKGVTLIAGLSLPESELRELGKQLKARCGAGGTVKDGMIELQGDHRAVVMEELKKRGWTVKGDAG